MGEEVRTLRKEATKRWKGKMPRFFRLLMIICAFISGTALAVNTAITAAGATPHEWWQDIFPYLIGAPAGVMFACKFTLNGGYKDVENTNTILDKDDF